MTEFQVLRINTRLSQVVTHPAITPGGHPSSYYLLRPGDTLKFSGDKNTWIRTPKFESVRSFIWTLLIFWQQLSLRTVRWGQCVRLTPVWRLIQVRLFILYFGVSAMIWAALREVKFPQTETWSRLLLVRWKTGGQRNREVGFLVNFLLILVCLVVWIFFYLFVVLFCTKWISQRFTGRKYYAYLHQRRHQDFFPLVRSYPDYIFMYLFHSVCA